MFQFSYKLKVSERVKAKCNRHPRYNPERDGRGGIKGGCSTCFSLFDLHQARLACWEVPEVSWSHIVDEHLAVWLHDRDAALAG